MKKLILAAALVAGASSFALAQGTGGSGGGSSGGQGTSASPNMTQNPGQGSMREDNPRKSMPMAKKSKKKKKKI